MLFTRIVQCLLMEEVLLIFTRQLKVWGPEKFGPCLNFPHYKSNRGLNWILRHLAGDSLQQSSLPVPQVARLSPRFSEEAFSSLVRSRIRSARYWVLGASWGVPHWKNSFLFCVTCIKNPVSKVPFGDASNLQDQSKIFGMFFVSAFTTHATRARQLPLELPFELWTSEALPCLFSQPT